MDFLDPAKKRVHNIRLIVGYVLVTILVLLSATILLYQAYGYGFGKNGQIIQNGLVFVSSSPSGADVYLNGQAVNHKTNTRLVLPAGQYTLDLKRTGYRDWIRSLGVEGGSVEHFDYPFLFPTKLATSLVQNYATAPGMVTQSPDQRWLLVQSSATAASFDLYDLNNRTQPPTSITLPNGLYAGATGNQTWQPVEWASDNRHVLLLHQYPNGREYILLDRQTVSTSINLTNSLSLKSTDQLLLSNKRYDHYFVFDSSAATLGKSNLVSPTVQPLLAHVLAFKTYGDNTVAYATDAGATVGKAFIKLLEAGKSYELRTVAAGSQYLLQLNQYNGTLYVAVGVAAEDKVYVYQDPVSILQAVPALPLVPSTILKVTAPNSLLFSTTDRFISLEGGQAFAVYDIVNDKTYGYQLTIPVVAGSHAVWMDGARLDLVSDGKLVVFDYDDANQQTLDTALPGSAAYFDSKYQWLYNLAPSTDSTQTSLNRTALTVPPAQ